MFTVVALYIRSKTGGFHCVRPLRCKLFGDDYEFFGPSFLFLSSQIGNAVPVKLAEQLGKSILDSR